MVTTKTIWVSKLPEFAKTLERTEKEIFDGIVDLAYESVVNGSAITGSPGQPSDLRDADPATGKDWYKEYDAPLSASIANNDKSARSVEDGISYKHGRALTKLHSDVGGFHSVALTVLGYDKIAAEVVRRVVGGGLSA
jgi:hypothetical protein